MRIDSPMGESRHYVCRAVRRRCACACGLRVGVAGIASTARIVAAGCQRRTRIGYSGLQLGGLSVGCWHGGLLYLRAYAKARIGGAIAAARDARCDGTNAGGVLPLGACCLVPAKLHRASGRVAASVRAGLLETLALARWPVEAFALVPAVIAQILAMTIATGLALAAGILLASMVYVAGILAARCRWLLV